MTDAQIERDIGRLLESVDGLRRDFEQADRKSDEHRRMVYTKLQTTETAIGAIAANQVLHETRLTNMEPEIESLRRMKQRGIGVLAAVGILSTLLGVTLADGWGKIMDGLRSLFGIGSL